MFKLVVFSCLAAVASASLIAPLAYTTPLLAPINYRGPLSLAPGQPASILAADGRPLDTLDVNLDRSAHYTAKALEGSGLHLLKKRSLGLAVSPISRIALPYGHSAPLIAPADPLALSTPITHYSPLTYAAPIAHAW